MLYSPYENYLIQHGTRRLSPRARRTQKKTFAGRRTRRHSSRQVHGFVRKGHNRNFGAVRFVQRFGYVVHPSCGKNNRQTHQKVSYSARVCHDACKGHRRKTRRFEVLRKSRARKRLCRRVLCRANCNTQQRNNVVRFESRRV